jgi:hypothetical protein
MTLESSAMFSAAMAISAYQHTALISGRVAQRANVASVSFIRPELSEENSSLR